MIQTAAPLDRLDPRSRVLAALGFAVAVTAVATPVAVGGALLLALGAAVAARLPAGATLRKLAALDGFMLMTLASLPFTVPGAPWWEIAEGWAISQEGTGRALILLAKADAAALATMALVGALPPTSVGRALARLAAPEALVQLYLFTVRYLDVLQAEYRRLSVAMRARGFQLRADRHSWTSLGLLIGMLMVRSLERSDRIVAAMRCRGFDGTLRGLQEERGFGAQDRWFGLASAAGAAALLAIGRG